MADAVRALPDQDIGPMEINGECRRGIHVIYIQNPSGSWGRLATSFSLAKAKTIARQTSAKYPKIRVRLVSYYAEKVEEIKGGSYVETWDAEKADWT